MNKYKLQIRHDLGTVSILIWANSIPEACRIAELSEKCPARSIISAKLQILK